MIWWDQLTMSQRRNGECPINTWAEMKAVMRRRFIPSYYHRVLYQKLQNLFQGSKSVDDYYKEIEVAMIHADVHEDREATMARFLAGLNREIANIVELQFYVEIIDMVHMAIKVEKQLKKKGSARGYSTSNMSKWSQGANKTSSASQANEPALPVKSTNPMVESSKGKSVDNVQTRSRDIKCFKCQGRGRIASQCPNRNTMVVLPNGEVELEEEVKKNEDDVENPSDNEDELEFAVEGEMLVVKRSLSVQSSVSEPQ
ncbi:mutant gag-pol polyprotein [Gossypium australe]|uniref:Mutant gag-pol polyprotein n=1 Tax=Gossypium australe TaxID=47621 RepID=A0A5B6V391_9ROSI|nr:mutant gag-pol polyprotein [Gossypium australe]